MSISSAASAARGQNIKTRTEVRSRERRAAASARCVRAWAGQVASPLAMVPVRYPLAEGVATKGDYERDRHAERAGRGQGQAPWLI